MPKAVQRQQEQQSVSLLLSLPDDVLKLVMQHVPRADRLKHACLASRRLHAAATAATKEVFVRFDFPAAPAFEWLARHGEHITRLDLDSCPKPLWELPWCPNLLDLSLSSSIGGSIQLGPATAAGGPPGVLQACTALTSLSVYCSALEDPEGVPFDGLSHLVGLRRLLLQPTGPLTHGLSAATLPSLSHLTHLVVHKLSLDNMVQLRALSSLQTLSLRVAGDVAAGPGSVPGLAFPAGLTWLMLHSPVEADLLPLLPTGLVDLSIKCAVLGPAGPFLSGMARLQQLTMLELQPRTPLEWPPAGPTHSALTASSSLEYMHLWGPWRVGVDLPEGVWPFMFPATHSLPHLTELSLCEDACCVQGSDTPSDPAKWGPTWGPAAVAGLVRCAPNLHTIHAMHLQHGEHVSQLQQLTALSGLHVLYGLADAADEVEWSMKHLGHVTQLKYLMLDLGCEGVGAGTLLPLTQLKGLTEFQCLYEDDGDEVDVSAFNTPGAEPDVYVKLLNHCTKETLRVTAEQLPEAVESLAQVSAQQQRRQALSDSCSLRARSSSWRNAAPSAGAAAAT